MSTFKYQEQFASELTEAWLAGKREHVRTTIRNLKNKAQAAYIAAQVAANLVEEGKAFAGDFVIFIHPNQ
jgi:DNA polymerase III delta subunit